MTFAYSPQFMHNKLTLAFKPRHILKKAVDNKYIYCPRSRDSACPNRCLCMKDNCFYTIAAVMELAVRRSNYQQALISCLEELGRSAIGIKSNICLVKSIFPYNYGLTCRYLPSFYLKSVILSDTVNSALLY